MRKNILFLLAVILISGTGFSQTRSDIFNNTPITWLGLDFTHLKYVGTATQFKDAGTITNADMRNKYFPGWNNLFIAEQKKYNVAEAVQRSNVNYALEVTQAANEKSNAEYFTAKAEDYRLLNEQDVASLVSRYDFKGKTGIGLLFFVEGMNKNKGDASMWVTFVDMGSKKMLAANRMSGAPGGMGFRNYWAKSFYNVLQDLEHDFRSWNK